MTRVECQVEECRGSRVERKKSMLSCCWRLLVVFSTRFRGRFTFVSSFQSSCVNMPMILIEQFDPLTDYILG